MMFVFAIISLLWSLALSQGQPDIAYLRGIPRQNDSSLMDYYFSCNGVGPNLFWQVGGSVLGFSGSRSIGDKETLTTPGLTSFATLLFTSPMDSMFRYSSVLIVTSLNRVGHVPFPVRCATGTLASDVTNNDTLATANNNSFVMKLNGNLYIDYLFTAYIVNETTPTYVYSCGVNDTVLEWLASGTARFAFSNTSIVGDDLTSSTSTVPELKLFLIASEPYELVSVGFATGIEALNVTCASNQVQESIYYSEVLAANSPDNNLPVPQPPPQPPQPPVDPVPNNPAPPQNPAPESQPCDGQCQAIRAVLIIIGLIGLLLCIVLVVVILCCCLAMNRKKNPKVQAQLDFNAEDSKLGL